MFLRGALGTALLAVPLASAVGQSASQHDPAAGADRDSSGGHRIAWVVGAGAASAAFFTSFVRMSERGATVNAERGMTLPGSPVPNHYIDGTLPGSGVSPGQNTPLPGWPPPPPQDSSTGADTTKTGVGGDPGPTGLNPPPNQPPPAFKPPDSVVLAVTTPEPDSIYLLGTGVVALIPALRRRRRQARS